MIDTLTKQLQEYAKKEFARMYLVEEMDENSINDRLDEIIATTVQRVREEYINREEKIIEYQEDNMTLEELEAEGDYSHNIEQPFEIEMQ